MRILVILALLGTVIDAFAPVNRLRQYRSSPIESFQSLLSLSDVHQSMKKNNFVHKYFSPNEQEDIFGLPLSPEDFAHGASLAADSPQTGPGMEDPIEMAGLFEGDIAHMDKNMMQEMMMMDFDESFLADGDDLMLRNAIKDEKSLWKNSEIPYVISSSYDRHERAVIAKAVMEFEEKTCIRVVPRTNQIDYVHVRKGSGCSSAVGVIGGRQELSLAEGCVYPGIVMHEFMHAAGFWHEQSRSDRDTHIIIHWDNILSGMDYNFHKYPWSRIQNLGESYDVNSIMHYGPYAFAADRKKPTITPIVPTSQMGQRTGFSKVDVSKLNKLYKCEAGSGVSTAKPPTVAACEDINEWCTSWAKQGECDNNPSWMHIHCAKSCSTCKACSDHNQYCADWSTSGECGKNWSYMSVFCRESCGLCDTASGSCRDTNRYCVAWAQSGECNKNPDYMMEFCQKACKMC